MADTEQVMEDYGLQNQYKENKSRYKMGLTDFVLTNSRKALSSEWLCQ